MGIMTTEELIETIKHKKSGDILYILEELYKSENKNKETSEEKIEYELTEDELETLKNGLIFVIKNDSNMKDKIIDILKNEASNRTRVADIGYPEAILYGVAISALKDVIITFIRARFPNKEIIQTNETSTQITIERGYSQPKDSIKYIEDLLKDIPEE